MRWAPTVVHPKLGDGTRLGTTSAPKSRGAILDRDGRPLMRERRVIWHRLRDGRFEVVPPPEDGIYRSDVDPGLWLDAAALLGGDLAQVLAVLHQGIASPQHQDFVAQLAARRAQ